MAWYKVTYSCGHTARVALIGREADRQRKIEWMGTSCLCPECWEKEKLANKAAFEEHKVEKANEFGLPELEGSEKQIKWASDIRFKFLEESEKIISKIDEKEVQHIALTAYSKITLLNPSAKWWIENRAIVSSFANYYYVIDHLNKGFKSFFKEEIIKLRDIPRQEAIAVFANEVESIGEEGLAVLVGKILAGEKVERGITPVEKDERETAAELEKEHIISCTLSPENPVSNVHAVITVTEIIKGSGEIQHRIIVKMPERNDEVNALFHALGYHYDHGWKALYIMPFAEEDDRIMEIAATLFKNGYIVELPRADMVQRVIDGDYKLYNPRRIFASGDSFAIMWGKKDWYKDWYREAKKLPGSKWDSEKKAILVPRENYEYIKDFAEINKFEIRESAKKLIVDTEEIKMKLIVCHEIKDVGTEKSPQPGEIPSLTATPVEIVEELKDEKI